MGLGSSSRTGTSRQATNAGFSLLGALNPATASMGGFSNETQKWMLGQDPIGSILQGVPGVITYDQFGNPQPVGGGDLPTLLPKITDIGNYDTVWEKSAAGSLPPGAQQMLDSFLGATTGPAPTVDAIDYGELFGGLGIGGGGVGGGGGVSATPPPNIGVLTSQIVEDLPEEFQSFISNTLAASSPERVGEILTEFEDAISARAQQNAAIMGEDALGVFAAQGGISGSAMAEMKSLALQAATEANAQIAAGRLEILNQQIQAMQVGSQLMDVLTSRGAQEQANLVALQQGELQANASIQVAQIGAQARLQETLIAATAQLEAQRIQSQTSLQLGQMDLLGLGYQGLLGENEQENLFMSNALKIPFDILGGVQQQTTTKQKDSGVGDIFGGLIGAGGQIGAAALMPAPV